MMESLVTSIIKRPYVFAFLVAYMALGWRLFGWRKTFLWLVSGYILAWASELSSIHNGFPYGEYHYIYETLDGELLIAGVPFFDSLSYVFLTFAGYSTATHILRHNTPKSCIQPILLGAILTTLLDVIIDPLATMGEKWFLGKIHEYATPGVYFGVPISNFAGWFLVAAAVISVNISVWRIFPSFFYENTNTRTYGWKAWLYPSFWAGIALFNIVITFSIGEWKLGIASSMVLGAVLVVLSFYHTKRAKFRNPF